MFPIPKRVFLTRGAGTHRHQLSAFEYALRDADIEQQNLVSVSSILPSQCELIPRDIGIAVLSPGEVTFCVLARAETNEPGRRVVAGIGLARPKSTAHYGYISEHVRKLEIKLFVGNKRSERAARMSLRCALARLLTLMLCQTPVKNRFHTTKTLSRHKASITTRF
jgi:arginine decarboxylase